MLADCATAGVTPEVTQLSASSAIESKMPRRGSAVCVGHTLYGLDPMPGIEPAGGRGGSRSVLKALKSRLIHAEPQPPHLASTAPQPKGLYAGILPRTGQTTVVGVIPFGLADGARPPAARQSPTVSPTISAKNWKVHTPSPEAA
jgi:hypothetical protein